MGRSPVFWGITGLTGAIIGVTLAVGLPFLVSFIVDQVCCVVKHYEILHMLIK